MQDSNQKRPSGNLKAIVIDQNLCKCRNSAFTDIKHIEAINELYGNIISARINSSAELYTARREIHSNVVPGWNDICTYLHSEAREAFLNLRCYGSKKNGLFFDIMKSTRVRFKMVLRKCKLNRDEVVCSSI